MNGKNCCDDPVDDSYIEIEEEDQPIVIEQGGVQGPPGISAYQVWLALGNVGTMQQFIQSLRGTPTVYNFPNPIMTWVINHNLGYYPQVTIYSPGGVEVDANVVNTSVNQVQVLFNIPYAGSAQIL